MNIKLPLNWTKSSLDEVCEILDNKRVPINSTEREKRISDKKVENLFPYYGATGQVGWIDDFIFEGEYVLLGEDGAPFLEAFKNKAYLVNGKFWVNNHAHILLSKINNKYLCYYLNTVNYQQYVSGTTRLKLNQSAMKQMPVLIAPANEQHRIVEKIEELFSKLDAAQKELKNVKQQLKRYRQSVLKSAFEGKLTEEWRLANSVHNNLNESNMGNKISNEFYVLPKNWSWQPLEKVVEKIVVGYVGPITNYLVENNGIPFISTTHIGENKFINKNIRFVDRLFSNKNKKSIAIPDDLIVARHGDSGKCCIVPNIFAEYQLSNAVLIRPDFNKMNNFYLCYCINYLRNILQKNKVGAVFQVVNTKTMSIFPIPCPTLEEQQKIVEEIETRFSVADKIEEEIDRNLKKTEQLRQSILKQAFQGKLVPQDPNDPPASELLKRIKKEKS